ncbi:Ypt Rab-specific GTPase-activating GYP6 [Olea europaea subsp. europaea]|uniref:Ypt Rab-specific GTPase-activating GYP6 n=1 Tax=Olea europaea subsp. europaea TaxID=158383 RepID=A0A8S0V9S4_OLEEU|nr:Ypt Rab-specific GTPase-activating GYP6 [Olea europaea subsp. europaea]
MSQVPIETATAETTSCSEGLSRFGDLRGVQWRIDLGILPSSSSIDDLRRVTANSRRRYAALRRQLLVDTHVPKDGSNSPDLVMDNPLSQNPGSMWGRFFKNAELERMVDQDLTRLYPDPGSYFQTPGCQGILRRILLLWCLRHPEYGYRQGMHELLAPLLYVLHVDVQRLSEVRKVYEDHFIDKFDGFSFHENDLTYKFDFKKFSDSAEDGNELGKGPMKFISELDPKIQNIVLLSDAYGTEGELGVVLSKNFMEHDGYSMFDALMSGAGGAVAMVEFFSPSPFGNARSGFPPVIEASAALYHLLSIVDSSLHGHLVELGVEPQYFALRWLRVLFGREFSLEDLLIIWDKIFSYDNTKFNMPADNDSDSKFAVLNSPRGAFISAFAVSIILHLRSPVLATENATACLKRLLNFPDDINLVKLLAKATSLQALAVDAIKTSLPIYPGLYYKSQSVSTRGHSLSLDVTSPRTPLNVVLDSYWEEKWRDLHKEEESNEVVARKQVPHSRKGWSERVRLRLSRTESEPSSSKVGKIPKDQKPSVRRNLLKDLALQLGLDENTDKLGYDKDLGHGDLVEVNGQEITDKNFGCTSEPRYLSGSAESEENSSDFSDAPSPIQGANGNQNDSEKSSIASNLFIDENDPDPCRTTPECSPLPVSDSPDDLSLKCSQNDISVGKSATGTKERKFLSGKFQWLWKFGRNASDGISDKASASENVKACHGGSVQNAEVGSSSVDGCDRDGSLGASEAETVEQNLMSSFRNLGQSMLENIQVPVSNYEISIYWL